MNTEEGLKREIGTWGLTSNIINVVIGSGIFVLPALVSEELGSAGILAYLFCGFLITIIMLCFAELGSKFTITGGAYTYVEVAFGKYFGFLTACLLIFGSCLLATAAVANALADTLSYIFPVFNLRFFKIAFFLFIFSGLTIVNVIGVKQGITLIKLTMMAKLAPLLLLILWGSTHIVAENLVWHEIPTMNDVGKISLLLFFAFQGAESSLSVGGEIKNPRNTIPRGILLSFSIILFFYIAIQLVAQGILGSEFHLYKDAPLSEAARRIMGPFGVTLMMVGAAISMFGYLSGDTLNAPRVLFRSSKDNVIPVKQLSFVHAKYATPYIAVISYTSIGFILAVVGEFKQLAILSSSAVLLVYLGVALAAIKLRSKVANDGSSFRIPGGYTVPILTVLAILWFLSNLTKAEMTGMIITLAVLSLIFYLIKFFSSRELK
jgi:amino acid transporter